MIGIKSVEKDIVRLRTRAKLREAETNMSMGKPDRKAPSAVKSADKVMTETDIDNVEMSSPLRPMPPQDKFSNDSEKLDFLCREMSKVAGLAKEIKEIKRQHAEKDKHITNLEKRIDDLE